MFFVEHGEPAVDDTPDLVFLVGVFNDRDAAMLAMMFRQRGDVIASLPVCRVFRSRMIQIEYCYIFGCYTHYAC
jgi:hypothetical protein